MIRTLAVTTKQEVLLDLPLDQLNAPEILWYWVDLLAPSEAEALLLQTHFHFHPLAIEDCFHYTQRPKLDHYEDHHFYVLHALNQMTLTAEEVDLFVSKNYLVSYHQNARRELDKVWERVKGEKRAHDRGPTFVAYHIMDKLVDEYFPALYQIEEHLDALEDNNKKLPVAKLMDQVFSIRSDLLKLRRTVVPMRDLVYRILNSDKLPEAHEQRVYFTDVYDHLLKLGEMIDSSRDVTSEMRDSYLSMNSNRMNSIMMTLTVITTLFMPLTLITGIYGMNFDYIPELHHHYSYFFCLGGMALIVVGLTLWFKRKGWFD